MRRKYLDDIGIEHANRHDKWFSNRLRDRFDRRNFRLFRQRRTYGFDERETWSLDNTFLLWLYERLKMYVEIGGEVVDLTYHTFEYKGETLTQKQIIDRMISDLEFVFNKEYKYNDDIEGDITETYEIYKVCEDKKKEICELWSIVLSSMWW